MTSSVSIFNIPHVLENIGSHLNRRDLASCALVNRTFYGEFTRLLWRHLDFMMRSSTKAALRMNSAQRRAILRNSRFVRQLSIHSHLRRQHMLGLLMSTCHRLTDLSTNVSIAREGGDTLFMQILTLATVNKGLQRWSLFSHADFSPMAFKRLTDTFQQTSCLTELHLGLVCSPRRGWLRRLLQSLPQTLRSIEVRWNQLNEDYEADYYPVQVWPEAYPCLESADFVINLLAEEQLTLTQFLERCRALRRCRLPTTESPESLSRLVTLLGSSKTFPILDTVDFGLTVELNGSDWERLLVLMKGRIKGIATCVPLTLPNNRHFISEMTKQWSETLEDICIGQPLSMSGSDIHLILTSCRKLRKFDCLHNRIVWPMTGRPGRADAYPGPDMVAIGQDDEIVAANWVCLELEELRLMFRDGRSKDDPQEQWTKAAVRYIYQQLGRLSNLKELAIGWKTTAALADCVNLDMSLESGLGYMKDLKALKKIDINHIHRTMIRQDEAEWMMTHWPSLTEIRGLEYQIDSTDEEGLDTMDWLRETRPQLTIE